MIKENLLFGIFHIMSLLFSFITSIMLARYLSIEDFGNYQFFLTIIGIVQIFKMSGTDMLLQKKILEKKISYFYSIYKLFFFKIAYIWIVVFMIFSIIIYMMKIENYLLYILSLIIFPFILFDRSVPVLLGTLNFKYTRFLVFMQSFLMFLVMYMAISLKFDVEKIIYMYFLVFIFMSCFNIIISYRVMNKIANGNVVLMNVDIKEILKLSVINGYISLSSIIERILLGIVSPSLLALFTVGQMVPRIIKDNSKVFLTPLFFKWASNSNNEILIKTRKYIVRLLVLGVTFFLIIFTFSDLFINSFYGEKYFESILIMQLLSVSIVFKFVESSIMSAITLMGEFKYYKRINFYISTFKILSTLLLVYYFNIWGAVIAILLTDGLKNVYLYLYLRRSLNE